MRSLVVLSAVLSVSGVVSAQNHDLQSPSYYDFTLVRNRPQPAPSMLTLRGGVAGTLPLDENDAIGQKQDVSPDGFVWYHTNSFTDSGFGLDAYAGRDGAVVAIKQGNTRDGGGGRLELTTRYFPFYREGYYDGDDYVRTGTFEGRDFGAYLGLSTQLGDGAMLEIGPFYRQNRFDRNDTTADSYLLPDDYAAYGGRLFFEHNLLELDRRTGVPIAGFLATVRAEYELNDADERFGTVQWMSKLPDSVWRAALHLEWLFPTEGTDVWEFRIDGALADDRDRIYVFDATKPIGAWWGDGSLGYRLQFGSGFYLTPFGNLQYTKTLNERGDSTSDDFWFGGGARLRMEFGDSLSVVGDYSYLNNANRSSTSYDEDVSGEQQFFAGLELRFGASRY